LESCERRTDRPAGTEMRAAMVLRVGLVVVGMMSCSWRRVGRARLDADAGEVSLITVRGRVDNMGEPDTFDSVLLRGPAGGGCPRYYILLSPFPTQHLGQRARNRPIANYNYSRQHLFICSSFDSHTPVTESRTSRSASILPNPPNSPAPLHTPFAATRSGTFLHHAVHAYRTVLPRGQHPPRRARGRRGSRDGREPRGEVSCQAQRWERRG
jgi:hypothetical protein